MLNYYVSRHFTFHTDAWKPNWSNPSFEPFTFFTTKRTNFKLLFVWSSNNKSNSRIGFKDLFLSKNKRNTRWKDLRKDQLQLQISINFTCVIEWSVINYKKERKVRPFFNLLTTYPWIYHSRRLFEDTGIVRVNQPVRDGDGLFLLHLHVPQPTIHVQAIGRWNTFH